MLAALAPALLRVGHRGVEWHAPACHGRIRRYHVLDGELVVVGFPDEESEPLVCALDGCLPVLVESREQLAVVVARRGESGHEAVTSSSLAEHDGIPELWQPEVQLVV